MIELRPYQVAAVEAALPHDGFALFMEQRTGKTPTAIEIIRRRRPSRLLIVCPKVAIRVWRKHIAEARLGITVRIKTYQSIWNARKSLRQWSPEMIIADESHRIKNHQSKQSKGVRYVARQARWKLALTGTPMDQGIEEMWAQFDFINPSLFGSWGEFKRNHLVFGGFGGYKIIRRINLKEFQRKLEDNSYRVTLDDVAPVKAIETHEIVRFELSPAARSAYEALRREFMFLVGEKLIVAPLVISQAMKLHQITGGFVLDEESRVHRIDYEKATFLGALLERIGKVPIVILCRFLEDMEAISAVCRILERTSTRISGRDSFEKFDTDVCIVQVQSGLAIDLSRAQHTIFYSMDYSYLNYDQSRFRIRAYDSKEAHYYYLLGIDSIDEEIYEVVRRKIRFSSFIVNRYRGGAMAVKKKVLNEVETSASIDLSPELERVRRSISQITDGEINMATKKAAAPAAEEAPKKAARTKKVAAEEAPAASTKSRRKPVFQPGAEAAAKEAAAPKAKKTTVAAQVDGEVVTLAALAEELGISPIAARRKLRNKFSEGHEGRARWAWQSGSKELQAVRDALSPSA